MSSVMSRIVYKVLKKTKMNQQLKREIELGLLDQHPNRKPSKYMMKKYQIQVDSILDKNVYTWNNNSSSFDTVLFYIHGGAYVHGFGNIHFRFFKSLIKKTKCTIVTPDYPLVPKANAEEIYTFLKESYFHMKDTHRQKNVILMGDSAGGGLALGLAQQLYKEGYKHEFNLILVSPWLDVSMKDELIDQIETEDPILNKAVLRSIGKMFCFNKDVTDPLISPLYGSLEGIDSIAIWTGTRDILYADAVRLEKSAIKQEKKIKMYIYKDMLHTWIFFGVPESKQAVDEISHYVKSIYREMI
jgi:acetyl esterase/lipase